VGGYGSGRWRTGRETVRNCRQLDINRFAREGSRDGSAFAWLWLNDHGEKESAMAIKPNLDGLRLRYTITRNGQVDDMDYLVSVIRVRVGYGERPYFLCPRC